MAPRRDAHAPHKAYVFTFSCPLYPPPSVCLAFTKSPCFHRNIPEYPVRLSAFSRVCPKDSDWVHNFSVTTIARVAPESGGPGSALRRRVAPSVPGYVVELHPCQGRQRPSASQLRLYGVSPFALSKNGGCLSVKGPPLLEGWSREDSFRPHCIREQSRRRN